MFYVSSQTLCSNRSHDEACCRINFLNPINRPEAGDTTYELRNALGFWLNQKNSIPGSLTVYQGENFWHLGE